MSLFEKKSEARLHIPALRSLKGCEKIAGIAGLTDESVCPTLVRKGLRSCGAGAFACQPISSRSGGRAE